MGEKNWIIRSFNGGDKEKNVEWKCICYIIRFEGGISKEAKTKISALCFVVRVKCVYIEER
jgi:hypothetical protein